MRIAAIDPGPKESAAAIIVNGMFSNAYRLENARLADRLMDASYHFGHIVIERIRAQGKKPVGNETFETAEWAGIFYWAAHLNPGSCYSHWLPRIDAYNHVTKDVPFNKPKTADARVRAGLIARFGKIKLVGDEWAAMAVAVTWWDKHGGGKQ